jgi:hypothetical protein
MVISGGNFKPDTFKPKEVVSLLLDDEELEKKRTYCSGFMPFPPKEHACVCQDKAKGNIRGRGTFLYIKTQARMFYRVQDSIYMNFKSIYDFIYTFTLTRKAMPTSSQVVNLLF